MWFIILQHINEAFWILTGNWRFPQGWGRHCHESILIFYLKGSCWHSVYSSCSCHCGILWTCLLSCECNLCFCWLSWCCFHHDFNKNIAINELLVLCYPWCFYARVDVAISMSPLLLQLPLLLRNQVPFVEDDIGAGVAPPKVVNVQLSSGPVSVCPVPSGVTSQIFRGFLELATPRMLDLLL